MLRDKTALIGVVSGLISMALMGAYALQMGGQVEAARTEALARYGGEQLEVCVASRDIATGETLDSSAIQTQLWVAALLPENAITNIKECVGKKAGSRILKGEVISGKRFETSESALDVPAGYSAISVPAHDVQAIGGACAPGMKVDVYAIGANAPTKILSSALILATSAADAGMFSSTSLSWLTLAVQPSSVEEVMTAAETMKLYFVLPGETPATAQSQSQSQFQSQSQSRSQSATSQSSLSNQKGAFA